MEWDWQVLFQNPGNYSSYWRWLLSAWGWTVSVSALSLCVALIVGTIVGIVRTLPGRPVLNGIAVCWTELFRNIPLLVQIFLWYHVVPVIFPVMRNVDSLILVVIGLGFYTSVRIAEQVRSGIGALPRGQRAAGMALGFTTAQTYRHVLLPSAFRLILPPLTSEAMSIVKNSSIAFSVSITELTWYAMQVGEETSRPMEIYFFVTTLYMVTAFAINRFMAVVEKKLRVPGLHIENVGGAKA